MKNVLKQNCIKIKSHHWPMEMAKCSRNLLKQPTLWISALRGSLLELKFSSVWICCSFAASTLPVRNVLGGMLLVQVQPLMINMKLIFVSVWEWWTFNYRNKIPAAIWAFVRMNTSYLEIYLGLGLGEAIFIVLCHKFLSNCKRILTR